MSGMSPAWECTIGLFFSYTFTTCAGLLPCDLVRDEESEGRALLAALVVVVAFPAAVGFYVLFLRYTAEGPTPGFNRLVPKPVGAGKAAGKLHTHERSVDDSECSKEGKAVSWLGFNELWTLEAICDTLLPGFDISTKENADMVIEQAVAALRSNIFPSKSCCNCRKRRDLPVRLELYTRAIARRSLDMAGRPASEVGVVRLYAESFEANVPAEQRAGLRLILWVLSTRWGAFLLTGRAVPFPAQSFAERHAVLRRWSRSRIVKLRAAFQGMKRLACSLYLCAHPDVEARDDFSPYASSSPPQDHPPASSTTDSGGRLSLSTLLAKASLSKSPSVPPQTVVTGMMRKTNPNWRAIRYDPQHHRFARGERLELTSNGAAGGGSLFTTHAKNGLWSGAKEKVFQAARAAGVAVPSPTRRYSNPPSPSSSACSAANPKNPKGYQHPTRPRFFSRSLSLGNIGAYAQGTAGNDTGLGAGDCGPGVRSPWAETMSSSSRETRHSSSSAPRKPNLSENMVVDVVVVGSGAGGGCAAGVLAGRGLKVAVLEKGGSYDTPDFAGFTEMEAYRSMYEKQGVMSSEDAGVVVLAGSCVGGGTTVNWTASFRTPRHVRAEWARKFGLKSFELNGPFDKALDAVCERLSVNTDYSHRGPDCQSAHSSLRVSQHNRSLWEGTKAAGLVPKLVPRNAKRCVDCGSCLHGCAFGNKRSTQSTWLKDGLDSGNLTLIPNAEVERVLMDGGRATGVLAKVGADGGGKGNKLTVLARAVVVAGGALHTPAILLRSGLKHPLIGRHLCLHPATIVGGVFPEDYHAGDRSRVAKGSAAEWERKRRRHLGPEEGEADPGQGTARWGASAATSPANGTGTNGRGSDEGHRGGFGRGVMLGVYTQDWMGLDNGYGFVIETPPMQPGLMGLCLPWNNAMSHRLTVAMGCESSFFICIKRDHSSEDNRIVLDPNGEPIIRYKLSEEDSRLLVRGRSEMLRLMRRAGASLLVAAHEGAPWYCSRDKEDQEDFEDYVQAVEDIGVRVNETGVYSAHQMGSCRLGVSPEAGPLRESGEAWECDGLFVADASTFPTAIGINPMITIEAIAYMVAEQVATRLGKESWPEQPESGHLSSPIGRRMADFGRAVARAISRESLVLEGDICAPAVGSAVDGDYEGNAGVGGGKGTPPRGRKHGFGTLSLGYRGSSPFSRGVLSPRDHTRPDDDFGVDLSKMSW